MYDKNHYNIVISLQLIKINGEKQKQNKQKKWLRIECFLYMNGI